MAERCPLCRSGTLAPVHRELEYRGKVIRSDAYLCSACREVVLDADQTARLRESIRREGVAASDSEVDEVLERLMLRPG